jgi:hypothetical protein
MSNGSDHPWLRPLWARVLIVVLCLGWASVEFYSQESFWGMIFGGLGLYALWVYIIQYRPAEPTKSEPGPPPAENKE